MICDSKIVWTSCPTTLGISTDIRKFWSANVQWPTVICSSAVHCTNTHSSPSVAAVISSTTFIGSRIPPFFWTTTMLIVTPPGSLRGHSKWCARETNRWSMATISLSWMPWEKRKQTLKGLPLATGQARCPRWSDSTIFWSPAPFPHQSWHTNKSSSCTVCEAPLFFWL